MGLLNRGEETAGSLSDYKDSMELPDLERSGLSTKGYQELVSNSAKNREALEFIVKIYVYFFSEEDCNTATGVSEKESKVHVDPSIAIWQDRKNLEKMVKGSQILLKGIITADTIHDAHALSVAYRMYVLRNIDNQLAFLVTQDEAVEVAREVIAYLSVEKTEPETLEEIDEYLDIIQTCLQTTVAEKKILQTEIGNLKKSLQAGFYITNILLGNTSN